MKSTINPGDRVRLRGLLMANQPDGTAQKIKREWLRHGGALMATVLWDGDAKPRRITVGRLYPAPTA